MLSPDPWLAAVLGWAVYKLDPSPSVAESAVQEALREVAGQADHVLVFARVPSDAVRTCERLIRSGFLPVDVGVSLESKGRVALPKAKQLVLRVSPEEREAVGKVAESCFRWSRFHLDPRIPDGLANLVKRRWVESCIDGSRGDEMYIVHLGNQPVGFLAAMRASDDLGGAAVIDLIGVSPDFQGRGIGQSLVRRFEEDWSDGCRSLHVSTQAANLSSIRFYERQGFQVCGSEYVLHAHCRDGVVT